MAWRANPGVLRETASRPGALGSSNHTSLSCVGGGGGGVGQYDNVH